MTLTARAAGVFIIAATPFTEGGAIDFDSADRLVEFYLARGVTGMSVLGKMGEAPKLSDAEARAFLAHMLGQVAGRVPVSVGVSNAGLGNIAALGQAAMAAGAAGVMIAPPRGVATDAALRGYFSAALSALGPDVPVCYQDFPLSTGVALSVEAFGAMVRDRPQLVMLKHEDWPGLNKLSAIRRAGGRRVSILCGNGGLFLPEEIARGADGAMTGFAYPEMLVTVVRLAQAGEMDAARDVFDAYLPLIRLEQQPGQGLAIRKEVLRRRGAIADARTRAPGPSLTAEDHDEITHLMRRLDQRLERLDV